MLAPCSSSFLMKSEANVRQQREKHFFQMTLRRKTKTWSEVLRSCFDSLKKCYFGNKAHRLSRHSMSRDRQQVSRVSRKCWSLHVWLVLRDWVVVTSRSQRISRRVSTIPTVLQRVRLLDVNYLTDRICRQKQFRMEVVNCRFTGNDITSRAVASRTFTFLANSNLEQALFSTTQLAWKPQGPAVCNKLYSPV